MKFLVPAEPRRPRLRSRDSLEAERVVSPWQEVDQWREAQKPEVLNRVRRQKGTWEYFLEGRYAYDLFPEMQHDLKLGPDDWERFSPSIHAGRKKKTEDREYFLGLIHFFPQRRLYLASQQQARIKDMETVASEHLGLYSFRSAQLLTWLENTDVAEWQKKLQRSEAPAVQEVRVARQIFDQVNGAADIVLSYSVHRSEMQDLVRSRWDEVRDEVERIRQEEDPYKLTLFLRNLRIILAQDVVVDKHGRLDIYPPGELEQSHPLPARSDVE